MTSGPATLNSMSLLIEDCLHATAPTVAEGYALIRTPNVGRGRLNLSNSFRVTQDTYETWTRRAIPQDSDLILAREAPAGNVAIVKYGEKVCLGQRTVLIRPNPDKIDPDFLCYYLLAPRQQDFLLSNATGVTAQHVNMKDIRRLPLADLPSLPGQRQIGSTLSAYDDLVENNRRRMALLEESARLLYQEWFVHLRFPGHEHTPIVDGVPDGWERAPLESALVLQRGFDLPIQERQEGEIPVWGSTGVSGSHNQAKVKGPGIVTGRSGTLGEVHYVRQDFWPLNTALWVKEFRRVRPLFAMFLLRSMDLKQYNGGVSVPTLDRKSVHRVEILIPRESLVAEFDEFAKQVFEQIEVLTIQNQKLSTARDLLLPRLMSGEICI